MQMCVCVVVYAQGYMQCVHLMGTTSSKEKSECATEKKSTDILMRSYVQVRRVFFCLLKKKSEKRKGESSAVAGISSQQERGLLSKQHHGKKESSG